MQHTHISLKYYLPGLSTDSALHYPTLPRGPPLATLAPKNIQLSDICELLVNQKPTKLLSQLEILEIMLFVDAQIIIQAQTPKSPQNPKSHLQIQNLTSESQISSNPQKPKWCFCWWLCRCCFCCVFSVWGMSLAKRSFCVMSENKKWCFVWCLFVEKWCLLFLNVILQKST